MVALIEINGLPTWRWHIDKPFLKKEEGLDINHVLRIAADGAELSSILLAFGKSIPHSGQPCQIWYGDTAKSIVWYCKNYLSIDGSLRQHYDV